MNNTKAKGNAKKILMQTGENQKSRHENEQLGESRKDVHANFVEEKMKAMEERLNSLYKRLGPESNATSRAMN